MMELLSTSTVMFAGAVKGCQAESHDDNSWNVTGLLEVSFKWDHCCRSNHIRFPNGSKSFPQLF